MIDPNQNTSEDVLRRHKEASYERMRIELKITVELLMKDYNWTWDDIARLLGMLQKNWQGRTRAEVAKDKVIDGSLTLNDLNALAHLFSCEPYIIFRPRSPWTKT